MNRPEIIATILLLSYLPATVVLFLLFRKKGDRK
jgi:hypothetical protein